MKKYVVFAIAIVVAQGFYIFKLNNELNIRKQINKEEILKIFEGTASAVAYTNYLSNLDQGDGLSEPSDITEATDIIERLEMLDSHSVYNPSAKWIKDVSDHAKKEIIFLRNHQMVRPRDISTTSYVDPHQNDCTRHSHFLKTSH